MSEDTQASQDIVLEPAARAKRARRIIAPEAKVSIAKRYLGGERIATIARDHDISTTSVYNILDAAGIRAKLSESMSILAHAAPRAAARYAREVSTNPVEAKDFLERLKVLPAAAQSESISGLVFVGLGNIQLPQVIPQQPALPEREVGDALRD